MSSNINNTTSVIYTKNGQLDDLLGDWLTVKNWMIKNVAAKFQLTKHYKVDILSTNNNHHVLYQFFSLF